MRQDELLPNPATLTVSFVGAALLLLLDDDDRSLLELGRGGGTGPGGGPGSGGGAA